MTTSTRAPGRVLVTGHRGYIGAVLGLMLLDRGYQVVGVDSDLYRRCDFGAIIPLVGLHGAGALPGRLRCGPHPRGPRPAGRAGAPRLHSAASAQTTVPPCARLEEFSLHADVTVPARRQDQLERMCRYLLRLRGKRVHEGHRRRRSTRCAARRHRCAGSHHDL